MENKIIRFLFDLANDVSCGRGMTFDWSSIIVFLPFFFGLDSSIRHQLISNAAQNIGGRLGSQY